MESYLIIFVLVDSNKEISVNTASGRSSLRPTVEASQ